MPRLRRIAQAILIASTITAPCVYSQVLEEVIVTAQKREQRLLDVPVAVSAISGTALDDLGITRIEDIEQLTPSLTVSEGTKNTNAGINIRGIGNNGLFSIGSEPAVLVVFDEVSQAQAGQAFTNIIDIERIEVLRGPQNTLFGKNASAGVVNIVTRAPAEEFEGILEGTATDDEELALSGSVSGPLSDTLGLRLTGYYSDREGFIENVAGGDDLSNRETLAVRGKMRWQPNADWDVTLNADYSDTSEKCCDLIATTYDEDAAYLTGPPIGILYSDMVPNIDQDEENLSVARDDPAFQESDSTGVSLNASYSFSDFILTSITAYNEWNNRAGQDVDFSARDEPTDFAGSLSVRVFDDSRRKSEFTSQEIRLLSPSYDAFDYLTGVYYSKIENSQRFQRFSGVPGFESDDLQMIETEGYAAFLAGNWRITSSTTLSAGARYYYEKTSADVSNFLTDIRLTANDDDSVWLYKFSAQQFFGEDNMLYASVSTGYKGQAYDTPGFDEFKAANPVGAEESINYEAGFKAALFDNTVRLNTAVFLTSYDNFQAQNFVVREDLTLGTQLLNVGELETKGVEVEGTAILGEQFRLMFGAAYIDAEVKEWDNAPCYPLQTEAEGCVEVEVQPGVPPANVQLSAAGNRLTNTPEWKFTLAADYSTSLGSLPFDGFVNFNYVWQDDVTYNITGGSRAVQDAYGIANLNFGIIESEAEKYRVTLFINNLFDEFYSAAVTDQLSGQIFTSAIVFRNAARAGERYAGLRLRFAF